MVEGFGCRRSSANLIHLHPFRPLFPLSIKLNLPISIMMTLAGIAYEVPR